ncbi:MAG: hypothetical protein H8D87_04780 [Deltaproteobacteria bacterium]|nr:hypothetical protein [Candidatus Desulfobacula maris]
MKPGQFFRHEDGKMIATIGEAKSFMFGDLLVVEELNPIGHSIIEAGAKLDGGWVEIGKPEWLREVRRVSTLKVVGHG